MNDDLLIVTPSAMPHDIRSVDEGIVLLRKVEAFGRISHRSEEAMTETSWQRFIPSVVLGHGDWSVTEHASVSVDAMVDRGITHEWVRHRIGSYTQESTRFVNYQKKLPPQFIMPFGLTPTQQAVWRGQIRKAAEAYRLLVEDGVSPQLARSVLPNALAARIIVTYNLRSWRHFFLLRTTKETHPQMREVSIPLLGQFKSWVPFLYDDIEPNAKQADNLKKPR